MKTQQTQKVRSTKPQKFANITLNLQPHHNINQSTGKVMPKTSKYASVSKSPQRLQDLKPVLNLNLSNYQNQQVSSTRNNANQSFLFQQQQQYPINNTNTNQFNQKTQVTQQKLHSTLTNKNNTSNMNHSSFNTIQANNSNSNNITNIQINTGAINNFQHHAPTSLTTTHAQYIKNQKTLNNNSKKISNISLQHNKGQVTPGNQQQSMNLNVNSNHNSNNINNVQTNLAQVQAIVQKNLAISLNQQIQNQQQHLLQQQQLVAQQLQQSGRFNTQQQTHQQQQYSQSQLGMNNTLPLGNTNNYVRFNNHSVLEVSQHTNQQSNNYFTANKGIDVKQQQKRYESVCANYNNQSKRMNQTLCVPSTQLLNSTLTNNNNQNIDNPYQHQSTIKKLELKLNLNHTQINNHNRDQHSVDRDSSQNNSVNKLRLWSSLDNQSSHSFGRKENKRYKDEDEENNFNNELMEIQEENSFMLTKENNVNFNTQTNNQIQKNQNNRTKNYELENDHFEDIKPIIKKKHLNMTLQQNISKQTKNSQNNNDLFTDFLSQQDLDQQLFKIPKFKRKQSKKEQSLVDEANRFSLNPMSYTANQNAGRETSQALTMNDQQDNINLANMIQRPQTNMLTLQANRNLQSQLSVHNNMNNNKKKNKTSMFSMRLRPDSELSSNNNNNTQTNNNNNNDINLIGSQQRNLQLDEHSLSRYNDREILSQTFTPIPQSAKNLNNSNLFGQQNIKPFGLSFIQPHSTKHQMSVIGGIDIKINNNNSLIRFTEAQERSKSRQKAIAAQQQSQLNNYNNTFASNLKFYSIREEPMSNEKAFSSNSKIGSMGSRSRERVKRDLNEQINQIQSQIQNKQVNSNYYKQQQQATVQNNYNHFNNSSNYQKKLSQTMRPNTSLNKSNNGQNTNNNLRQKPNTNFQQIDKKVKPKTSLHNKIPTNMTQRNNGNQKGFQLFKQFTNQSFLTNSNFDSKLSGRPLNNQQQQQYNTSGNKQQNTQNYVKQNSQINSKNNNNNVSRPYTSMVDNQICLGLAYMVSSKIFMRIQVERQLHIQQAFDKIKQEAMFTQDIMEHIHGHGNKPHQNIKHCKDHSRNLSLLKITQKSSKQQNNTTFEGNMQMQTQQPRVDTYFKPPHKLDNNITTQQQQIMKQKAKTAKRQSEQPKLNQRAIQLLFHPSSDDNTIVEEDNNQDINRNEDDGDSGDGSGNNSGQFIRQSYDGDVQQIIQDSNRQMMKSKLQNLNNNNNNNNNNNQKQLGKRKVSNSQQPIKKQYAEDINNNISISPNNNNQIILEKNHNSDNYYEINLNSSDAAPYLSQQDYQVIISPTSKFTNQQSADMQSNPIVMEYNTSSVGQQSIDNNNNNILINDHNNSIQSQNTGTVIISACSPQQINNANNSNINNNIQGSNINNNHFHHNSEHFNVYNNSIVENVDTQHALLVLNQLNSVTDNHYNKQSMRMNTNNTDSDSLNGRFNSNKKVNQRYSSVNNKQHTIKQFNPSVTLKNTSKGNNVKVEQRKRQEIENQLNNILNDFGIVNESTAGPVSNFNDIPGINTHDSNVRSATTSSTMAIIEKLQGDSDLKKKLDKVISILSAIKNDFN